ELEKLVAMVERECKQLTALHARRGNAMQARERGVLVGARDSVGIGNEVIELDTRWHRRCATVARDDQRAAGICVAAAGVVVLATHPSREEARRKRVACAQNIQHVDLDAAAVERVIERSGNRAVDDRAPQGPALARSVAAGLPPAGLKGPKKSVPPPAVVDSLVG